MGGGRGLEWGRRAGRVHVCVCISTRRVSQVVSLPLGSAQGTPSRAQSQAHPSHPCSLLGRASGGPKGPASACSIPHPAAGEPGHHCALGGRVTSCQLWDLPGHLLASSCLLIPGHMALGGAHCATPPALPLLPAARLLPPTPAGRQSGTRSCQGTVGTPHSWFLSHPGHMALASTLASGFG